MVSLLVRNDGSIADQGIVDPWIRHQIRLELRKIDVQSAVETQTGRDGADDLGNQTIQVFIVRSWDIQVATTNVVDCFVVDQKCTI